jgi:hypothetical protein
MHSHPGSWRTSHSSPGSRLAEWSGSSLRVVLARIHGTLVLVGYGAPVVEGKPVGEAGSDDSPFRRLLHLEQLLDHLWDEAAGEPELVRPELHAMSSPSEFLKNRR